MVDGVGTTHHVKIGDYYYLIRPGSYRKMGAPPMGARFSTGDPDYNNLSKWQHWVQDCWVGGFGAPLWEDEAMYDEGAGIDTTNHDMMILTRDLTKDSGLGDVTETREFIVFNDTLYILCHGISGSQVARLYKYDAGAGTWSNIKTFSSHAKCAAVFDGKLFIGEGGSGMAWMSTAEVWSSTPKPAGVTAVPGAMMVFRGLLYVAFDRDVWRMQNDQDWDGSTAFYTSEASNEINCMETHLGFLYMGTRDGHIIRTDANNTFDMWDFSTGIQIQSIRSFDGRLFIGCVEPLLGTSARQGILYQFSGAAVTELKRWGELGSDIFTGRMRVIGPRLYYGAPSLLGMGDGFGIATYDPAEDAHHIWATNKDAVTYAGGTENRNWLVDDVMFFKGQIFCSVRGHGVFFATYSYRDVERIDALYDTTPDASGPHPTNSGWYTSSDFDAGTPGLQKAWNGITIYADLQDVANSIDVEYSIDGGETWVAVGTLTKTIGQRRYHRLFILDDGAVDPSPVYSPSFKYRIALNTDDTESSPILRGVVVRYLPIPEPSWDWHMTLVLSDNQHLLDNTLQAPDNETKLAELREKFRTQEMVNFIEPDGTEWSADNQRPGVLITRMEEHMPLIGPTSAGELEYEIPITLSEMQEHYES